MLILSLIASVVHSNSRLCVLNFHFFTYQFSYFSAVDSFLSLVIFSYSFLNKRDDHITDAYILLA